MWQDIVVYIIIAFVVGILVHNAYKMLKKENASGCNGCTHCSPRDKGNGSKPCA